MTTKIILSFAVGLALSLTVVGCGTNGSTGGGTGGTGGTGGGGPDMTFVCVKNPTTATDFLNACPPAGVDTVLINPTFPALAPNGKLPALQ